MKRKTQKKSIVQENTEKKSQPEITFDEMYKAVTHVLINGSKEQQKEIWKLLNEGEGNWVWIKMKIITSAYNVADAKGKEEFCLIAMQDHLEVNNAVLLKDKFVDEETGVEYRVYKYRNGLLHRIPFVTEGMDKTTFDVALNKMFLGDYLEFHTAGSNILTLIPLDTPEKVADYNKTHNYYKNHPLYKDSEPIMFDPRKDIINQTPKG